MAKTYTPKLTPVIVKNAKSAATLAQQDGRKRPIVAINEEGKLVVCCRRTAKKNSWQVQDILYERAKVVTEVESPVSVPAKAIKPAKTTKDKPTKTIKAKAVKKPVDTRIDDILGE